MKILKMIGKVLAIILGLIFVLPAIVLWKFVSLIGEGAAYIACATFDFLEGLKR